MTEHRHSAIMEHIHLTPAFILTEAILWTRFINTSNYTIKQIQKSYRDLRIAQFGINRWSFFSLSMCDKAFFIFLRSGKEIISTCLSRLILDLLLPIKCPIYSPLPPKIPKSHTTKANKGEGHRACFTFHQFATRNLTCL